MLKRIALLVAVLCPVFFLCPRLYSQANGSLSGNVTDKTGSVIAGASVRITSQATGLTREVKTDDSGHYLVPLLPPSVYTIHVESQGFRTTEQKDIRLQISEQLEIDFSLVLASVSSTVEVNANEVAVETSNPSLGQVITEQQVAQLPLDGRDFVQLASLTPGAIQETNPNSFFTQGADSEVAARGSFSLSVGGSRPNSTDWILDGVDNNELTSGGIGIFSSIDDIQEFKVLTYNYSAEYGTRAGPTVIVTSKSGANQFHGSLYEFLRNTALDAKSFFATSAEKFNLNQYGGSIGGPIQKDKTFFFIDGEQKDQRHGIAFTGLLPTLAMRNGDFSADNFGNPVTGSVTIGSNTYTVPGIVNPNMVTPSNIALSADPTIFPNAYFQCDASGNPLPANSDGSQAQGTNCAKIPTGTNGLADRVGQALINLYPAPNANAGCTSCSFNFVNQPVRKLDETKFDVRLDHNFSATDVAFARFSYDQANSYVPGGAGPGMLTEASAFGSNQIIINHARQAAIGETHTFSATTINQATFGYNRIFDYILSQGNGTCASATIGGGIPGANLGCPLGGDTCASGAFSCGLVSVLMTAGYWAIGDRGYSPFQGGTNIYSFSDTIDLIRGKHDIRAGFGFRANQMNTANEAFQDGFWIPGVAGNFSGFICTNGTPGCPSTTMNSVSIAGNPEADVLMGLLGLAEHDQTFNGTTIGRRWKIYRPFVNDDWRVTKGLTLNLGLAWDMTTPISEQHGRLADYDPFANKLLVANQNGVNSSAGVQMYWKGLEPRIGLAWKILGSDKTVFRAGYGIFHDSSWNQGAQGLWTNPPFFAESDFFGPAGCALATSYCATTLGQSPSSELMSAGFPIFTGPPTLSSFSGTLFYQPTNFKPGSVQQFNANVERQLPGNVVVTAGYAGARGHHILVSGNNINTPGPSACGTVSGYTLGCNPDGSEYVPLPAMNGVFNSILEFADLGDTKYDSLQIKGETKTRRYGLYALISYTYAHAYDNGLSDGLGSLLSAPYFPLPNWQKLDWAPSQIGVHNNFTGSVIYDLPFGKGKMFGGNWSDLTNTLLGNWQLTLIEHISSGFPDPLINTNDQSGVGLFGAGFNNGGNGNNYNRPDQMPGCNPYAADHGKQQWINASCFPAATPGQLGNANRVPVVGPDFVNTDFSIIKQFALPREGMGLNFRAEFFNLFNHAQFGLPVSDISAPGFGAVNSIVNNPRLVQFALKLTF
jgi:hypothetical protein